MSNSTLSAIRTKIRRLTRTPSLNQMSNAVLDEYINTFVLYDFPDQIRTFDLRSQFSFYTVPYVDTYPAGYFPLADFVNTNVDVFPPVYINGTKAYYTQSREQFYNIYPLNRGEKHVSTGDGVAVQFSGTITPNPLLTNNVVISYANEDGSSESFHDIPIRTATGALSMGNLYSQGNDPSAAPSTQNVNNYVNYADGTFVVTFISPPDDGIHIIARSRSVQPSQPQGVLFWDNTFELRPTPDDVYQVNMEVNVLPTELLTANQNPNLNQWWQYIAYGSAKKIFEDRMDLESVQMILPEMKMQERLVLRRTLVQLSNERTPTVYSEQTSLGSGTGYDGFNGF